MVYTSGVIEIPLAEYTVRHTCKVDISGLKPKHG